MWLGASYGKFGGAKLLTASPTLVKPSSLATPFTEVPGGLSFVAFVAISLTLSPGGRADPGVVAAPKFPGVPGLSGLGSAPATPASGTASTPAAIAPTTSFLIMVLSFCRDFLSCRPPICIGGL